MTNKRNILLSCVWPILLVIGQLFILFLMAFLYYFFNQDIFDQKAMVQFLNQSNTWIILLSFVVLFPIFFHQYKKRITPAKSNWQVKQIVFLFLLGGCTSIVCNTVFYQLNQIIPFTDAYDSSETVLPLLLTTGLLGPILEELVFRGLVYTNLKQYIKPMTAIVISTILFSLFHTNIMNMIYAFGLGFLLIYVYEKHQTILAPIIVHCIANITSIVMVFIFSLSIIWLSFSFFCFACMILIILVKQMKQS